MTPLKPDFLQILRVLRAHEVRFIVVGGVSGVLHGAPVATFDLDLVHQRTEENVGRLLQALLKMGTRYRGQAGRDLKLQSAHLSGPGHQLLMTDHGPLNVRG